jgi:hypothetical protein
MKSFPLAIQPWVSNLSWFLGPVRWWLLALSTIAVFCVAVAMYWNHEAALLDAQGQVALQKIKSKRTEQRQSLAVVKGGATDEKVAQIELRLPPVQATKASPLGKFLSDSKLKGVTLKQVDYVWPKANRVAGQMRGQSLGVGKIEVNLTVEGGYPAVRAWLGELLVEESNVQVNAIQFQRLTRDSAVVNSVITLSVYFQEAT